MSEKDEEAHIRPTNHALVFAAGAAVFLGAFLIRDKDGVALGQKPLVFRAEPMMSQEPSWIPFLTWKQFADITCATMYGAATALAVYLSDRNHARREHESAIRDHQLVEILQGHRDGLLESVAKMEKA